MNVLQDWHNRGVGGSPAPAEPGIGFRAAIADRRAEAGVIDAGIQPQPAPDGSYLTGLDPETGMPDRPRQRAYAGRTCVQILGGTSIVHA